MYVGFNKLIFLVSISVALSGCKFLGAIAPTSKSATKKITNKTIIEDGNSTVTITPVGNQFYQKDNLIFTGSDTVSFKVDCKDFQGSPIQCVSVNWQIVGTSSSGTCTDATKCQVSGILSANTDTVKVNFIGKDFSGKETAATELELRVDITPPSVNYNAPFTLVNYSYSYGAFLTLVSDQNQINSNSPGTINCNDFIGSGCNIDSWKIKVGGTWQDIRSAKDVDGGNLLPGEYEIQVADFVGNYSTPMLIQITSGTGAPILKISGLGNDLTLSWQADADFVLELVKFKDQSAECNDSDSILIRTFNANKKGEMTLIGLAPGKYFLRSPKGQKNSYYCSNPYYARQIGQVKAVYSAANHSCAILGDVKVVGGVVKCWGSNSYGESGLGSDPSLPTTLVKGPNVKSMALGKNHTCSLNNSGDVYCLGKNDLGQLGDGNNYGTSVPQKVLFPVNTLPIISIAAGYDHTCALSEDKKLFCWGHNLYGQLGISGDKFNTAKKVTQFDTGEIFRLFAGGNNTCVLWGTALSKSLRCMGSNEGGQLGIGMPSDGAVHMYASFLMESSGSLLAGVTQVVIGEGFMCALLNDENNNGRVKCWGSNQLGQIGDGLNSPSRLYPTTVGFRTWPGFLPLENVINITAGSHHTCALVGRANPQVWCWGSNESNALGINDENVQKSNVATLVTPKDTFGPFGLPLQNDYTPYSSSFMSAGYNNTCIVAASGNLVCWGDYVSNAKGNTLTTTSLTTALVNDKIEKVVAGDAHACLINGEKSIKCWGSNSLGQLGIGLNGPYKTKPTEIDSVAFNSISSKGNNTSGYGGSNPYHWGSNAKKQIDDTDNQVYKYPQLSMEGGVDFVSQGVDHVCTFANKVVKCRGAMDINYTFRAKPISVASGNSHTCALLANGQTYCWGKNDFGQLGVATTESFTNVPQLADDGARFLSIYAGGNFTCGIKKYAIFYAWFEGLVCWGQNNLGQLGNRQLNNSFDLNSGKEKFVSRAFTHIKSVALGKDTGCLVDQDNQVFCWGANYSGILGVDPTTGPLFTGIYGKTPYSDYLIPIKMSATGVAVGLSFACAYSDYDVQCWGSNFVGQLGNDKGLFLLDYFLDPQPLLNY